MYVSGVSGCIALRSAFHLLDKDSLGGGKSDPYMEVRAVDSNGQSVTKTTSHRQGDQSPEWHQRLNFGKRTWRRFYVRLWDSDIGRDDALSSEQTTSHSISVSSVYHNAYGSGYARFNYMHVLFRIKPSSQYVACGASHLSASAASHRIARIELCSIPAMRRDAITCDVL